MDRSTPGFPVHQKLPELTQTQVHQVGVVIQTYHPLSPPFLLPSIFPNTRVFSNESVLHIRWPKYWSLPMTIQDLFPLGWTGWISLLSKGLSSLLQQHSSKASILQHSVFFIVQLSHPYMTTGKTIALTRWTFVGKVRSLLYNMLSRLVITFLTRSKRL